MRVLMLTGSLPYPPLQGGALRSFGIVHGLHAAGHEVVLLSFHEGALNGSTPLTQYCAHIETVPPPRRRLRQRLRDLLLSGQADIARRLYSHELARCLQALLGEQEFDLVQAEGLEMACYLPLARAAAPQARLCYDAFNAEYALQQEMGRIDRADSGRWPAALYSLLQVPRIRAFEQRICCLADLVIAVSPEDAAALQTLCPEKEIPVLPNGIFVERYTSSSAQLELGEAALVFTGTMDYRPNVDAMLWFVKQVLPLVQARVPEAQLYIVGQKPHNRLTALRETAGVHLTGRVPQVQPYLHSAAVYVAPLRMGGGTRLKIMEAMAAGCAIVATHTAASGLHPQAKRALLLADSAAEMAQTILTLLEDEAKRQMLGAEARRSVAAYYDWSVLIPQLLALYGRERVE
ncbi:MAG: glycosyltransferase [Chloroflexi bacterium]|nr:glycosyltransferase [Chloroflexota bacterium]